MIKFFEKFPEIIAVMSGKKDGDMKVNYCNEKKCSTNKNRKRFFAEAGAREENVASALLNHGADVQIVGNHISNRYFSKTDGLITSELGIFLSVTAADCYPVLFYEPVKKIISLAHVGWRGAIAGIVGKIVAYNLLKGANIFDLRVEVGPGICQNHFEFDTEDLYRLGEYCDEKYFYGGENGKVFVDLEKIILNEILRSGISDRSVKFSAQCTFCEDKKYFSARRDSKHSTTRKTEVMAVLLGMKERKIMTGKRSWRMDFAYSF